MEGHKVIAKEVLRDLIVKSAQNQQIEMQAALSAISIFSGILKALYQRLFLNPMDDI